MPDTEPPIVFAPAAHTALPAPIRWAMSRRLPSAWWTRTGDDWVARIVAAALVCSATLAMLALRDRLNVLNVSLLYLIVVTLIAFFTDRWTSIALALVAFAAFNFLFIEPYYTFTIADPDHALVLFVFLGVATLISQLVTTVRRRTIEALERGRRTETLYALSQALISDITADAMLATIVNRVVEVLGVRDCAILMPDAQGEQLVRAARGEVPPAGDREHAGMLAWVVEHGRPATLGPPSGRVSLPRGTLTPAQPRRATRPRSALYVPIQLSGTTRGVLYVANPASARQFSNEDGRLLQAFSNHAALALDRVRLTEEATRAAVLARSDELKSSLLSAVSHDLRTPLTSIKAAATSLLQDDLVWSPADQRDLLQTIDEETDRLTRIVSNLLDLSRIESGRLRPAVDWNDIAELVLDTIERMRPAIAEHPVAVTIQEDLPLVRCDYVEIAQVLANLLENAAKYSPATAPIEVMVEQRDATIVMLVADRGPGVPLGQEARIFEKFHRLEQHHGIAGSGIGLSISKGIVEAHGGAIGVEQRPGGGAVFRMTLPIAGPPAAEQ